MDVALAMYRLQKAETERSDATRRLNQIRASLENDALVSTAVVADQQAKDALAKAEAATRDIELALQSLRSRLRDNQTRMFSGKIGNPKELASLQSESESLQRRIEKTEDELLETMIALDEAREAAAAAAQRLVEARAERAQQTEDLRREQAQLEARVPELETMMRAIRESLSPEDLESYEYTARRKGGKPVAVLRRGDICGACGVGVPVAVAREARERGAITFCPSCERILCATE